MIAISISKRDFHNWIITLFTIAVTLGLLTGAGFLPEIHSTLPTEAWSIISIVGLFFFALAALLHFTAKHRERLALKFKDAFRYEPPANSKEKTILQPRINAVLKQLAEKLRKLYGEETKFLTSWSSLDLASEPETDEGLKQLEKLREGIEQSKKEFWATHAIARHLRFKTMRKHGEYLHFH